MINLYIIFYGAGLEFQCFLYKNMFLLLIFDEKVFSHDMKQFSSERIISGYEICKYRQMKNQNKNVIHF